MTDNTELKRLAKAAPEGPWYQHGGIKQVLNHDCETVCETFEEDGDCPTARFIAAANPTAVLALIAENERLQHREQDLSASVKYWFNACGGKQFEAGVKHADEAASKYIDEHWRQQRDRLRAEIAGLKTGYEAYERVNAELKAEVEGLREEIGGLKEVSGVQVKALKTLTFAARTTGGTAGPDEVLMKACEEAERSMSLGGIGRAYMVGADAALGQGEQS